MIPDKIAAAIVEGRAAHERIERAKQEEAARVRAEAEAKAAEARRVEMEKARTWVEHDLPAQIRAAAAQGKKEVEVYARFDWDGVTLPARVVACKEAGLELVCSRSEMYDMDTGHVDGHVTHWLFRW